MPYFPYWPEQNGCQLIIISIIVFLCSVFLSSQNDQHSPLIGGHRSSFGGNIAIILKSIFPSLVWLTTKHGPPDKKLNFKMAHAELLFLLRVFGRSLTEWNHTFKKENTKEDRAS